MDSSYLHYFQQLYGQPVEKIVPSFEVDEIPIDISQEEFISRAIYTIFKITFTEPNKKDFIYLEDLSKSLSSQGDTSTIKLNEQALDRILMEILCLPKSPFPNSFLTYPVSCYARLHIMMKKEKDNKERLEALKRFSHLTLSYLTLAMNNVMLVPSIMDDAQSNNTSIVSEFVDVISVSENEQFSPCGFVNEVVSRLNEMYGRGAVEYIFETIFEDLRIRTIQIVNNEKFYYALEALLQNDILKEIVVTLENWIPKERFSGKEIEVRSILGPFFRIEYNHKRERNISSIKQFLNQFNTLNKIIINLLEYEGTRSLMKKWIFEALYRNKKRNAINVETTVISSDDFMMHLNKILISILMNYLKISEENVCRKIDIYDVIKHKQLFEDSLTRIFAESDQVNQYFVDHPVKTDKSIYSLDSKEFLGEIFSYTLMSFDLGGIHGLRQDLNRQMPKFSTLDCDITTFIENNLDSNWLNNTCQFLRLLSKWIIYSATDQETFTTLPLKSPSIEYQLLPQFIFENMAELFILIPPSCLLSKTVLNDVYMNFMISILYTPDYIKNPYLKGKYSEVISIWCTDNLKYIENLKPNVFKTEYVVSYLGPSLFKLYMNDELQNLPTQFFEKYHEREFVFIIFEYIWSIQEHKDVIIKYLEDENELLKFSTSLVSDILYLIDVYLTLQESYKNNVPVNDELRQMIGSAKILKRISRNSIEFIYLLIRDSTHTFIKKEILEEIAGMINYCISRLYKQEFVRSDDESDRTFFYTRLLNILIYIYKEDKVFVDYILNDEKSTFDIFQPLLEFVKQDKIFLENFSIDSFEEMIKEINEKKEKKKALEEKIGEIPEEYIDPIIGNIMKDPVKLPSSNIIVDRITIEKHLMSDKTDPFNRLPLDIKDLIPQPELKKTIESFLASKMEIEEGE